MKRRKQNSECSFGIGIKGYIAEGKSQGEVVNYGIRAVRA